MHLDSTIRLYFRNLASWIETELPKVRHNSTIWQPFLHYAQLDEEAAIKAIFCNNTPPIIDVAFLDVDGVFYRDNKEKNKEKIHLNRKLCRKFNKYKSGDERPYTFELIMKAIILHEMVHWGDSKDGKKQDGGLVYDKVSGKTFEGDIGFKFEEEAFYGIYSEKFLEMLNGE